MVIKKQKAMGVHFTPPELARFVARRIINAFSFNASKHLRVLDPACGDGELLLAFAEMLPKAFQARCTLVGIESDCSSLHRASKRLAHLPAKEVELHEDDFFGVLRKPAETSRFISSPFKVSFARKTRRCHYCKSPLCKNTDTRCRESTKIIDPFRFEGANRSLSGISDCDDRSFVSGGNDRRDYFK